MITEGSVIAGALADQGKIRDSNEDRSFYCRFDLPDSCGGGTGVLAAVADGMGGHAAGEAASERAIQVLQSRFFESVDDGIDQGSPAEWTDFMIEAVEHANREVYEEAGRWEGRSGMGTTLTAAAIIGDYLYVGHVGDSRAYVIHQGDARQVTQDDTWTADQVRRGLMTEEDARNSERAGQLLRVLGRKPDVKVSAKSIRLFPGDVVLLCTDGLTGVVSNTDILNVLKRSRTPQAACDQLVSLANRRGGPDNVAVLVLSYKPELARKPKTVQRRSARKAMIAGLIAVLVLLAADAVYIVARYSEVPKPADSASRKRHGPSVSVTVKEPAGVNEGLSDPVDGNNQPGDLTIRDLSGGVVTLSGEGE